MKILHTSDWHLGKKLDRFERIGEQREVLEEICRIAEAEQVDAIIIAGDLFDTYNPPTEAVELFYRTVARLSGFGRRAVIAIAGNHDSPDRIEAPDVLAREAGILFIGYPGSELQTMQLPDGLAVTRTAPGFAEVKLPNCSTPLRLLLAPYANESRLHTDLGSQDRDARLREILGGRWKALAEEYCDEQGVNLLVAHLLFARSADEVPEEPEEEKPINPGGASFFFPSEIPSQIQYTALGHLHQLQNLSPGEAPILYCGSPLSYSFGEAGQQKFVVIVEAEAAQPATWRKLPLTSGKPVYRYTAEGISDAIAWLGQHQGGFVELFVRTDHWITAAERKQILDAHEGIVGPLPILSDMEEGTDTRKGIDLSQSLETLFEQFFEHRTGKKAGERMMSLFREMHAVEGEES